MFELTTKTIPKTAMDVFEALPEGTRAEVIDNVLYMAPAPLESHQRASGALFVPLYQAVVPSDKGIVYPAPLDVFFPGRKNAVQPDIVVILKASEGIIKPDGRIRGVPDLLVEFLSPGNRDHDLVRKKDLYERFGVREYFVIEPESRLTLGYVLEGGKYALRFEGIRRFESALLGTSFEW